MAKFLNKKEQVIDFKLTPYGKQRLSVGQFEPVFYSFLMTEFYTIVNTQDLLKNKTILTIE